MAAGGGGSSRLHPAQLRQGAHAVIHEVLGFLAGGEGGVLSLAERQPAAAATF